jgi:hypothetical protein
MTVSELSNYIGVNEDTNNTTKFLTPMIFTSGAQAARLLFNFGLVNVYLDDYGFRVKHCNCLFFLFEPVDSAAFKAFEGKITNFDSFFDYYEVDERIMYVFKPNKVYHKDLEMFKQGRFDEFSEDYKILLHKDIKFDDVVVDITKEIYRFEESLKP